MGERVILVPENIFIEDIEILIQLLSNSLTNVNIYKLMEGLNNEDYKKSVLEIKKVNEVLKNLKNKNFNKAHYLIKETEIYIKKQKENEIER